MAQNSTISLITGEVARAAAQFLYPLGIDNADIIATIPNANGTWSETIASLLLASRVSLDWQDQAHAAALYHMVCDADTIARADSGDVEARLEALAYMALFDAWGGPEYMRDLILCEQGRLSDEQWAHCSADICRSIDLGD